MANNTTINVTDGHSQYNSKSFSKSKAIIGKFYKATHAINDVILQEKSAVKGFSQIVSTDKDLLNRIALGDTDGILKSASELDAEIKVFSAKLEESSARKKAFEEKQAKSIQNCLDLVPVSLFEAYKVGGDEYVNAMTLFMADLGLEQIGTDDINTLILSVGNKATSAKKASKTGRLCEKVDKIEKYAELLMRTFSDLLANPDEPEKGQFPAYVYKIDNK